MCEIKDVIEEFMNNWSFTTLKKHPTRRNLFDRSFSAACLVTTVSGREFKIRFDSIHGDIRVWSNSDRALTQWRTCPVKSDRFIYKSFTKGSATERISMENIFLDPLKIDNAEVEMFKVLYPDLALDIPLFGPALSALDKEISRNLVRGVW